MSGGLRDTVADHVRLVRISARLVAGRRYWIAPLLPLIWIGFQIFRLLVGWRADDYAPVDAQGTLIGFPMTVLGIGLGLRIIAGEIDRRTLEIAYTVPGGTQRVWMAKLAAAIVILLVSEALLVVATAIFCTSVPFSAVYGALQASLFYMVLAMWLAALFRSEAAGALVILFPLGINSLMQGQVRISPFWNPLTSNATDPAELIGHAVQNRIGFLLVTVALTFLAFARAERREKLLGS